MTEDEIGEGLAACGVALFADRPPADAPRPDVAELIRACIESRDPRLRASVIALLVSLDEPTSRAALATLAAEPPPETARWLRRLVLAATYLARMYRSELTFLLGRPPAVPGDLFPRNGLPDPEEDFGTLGLRALAEEIGAAEGPEVNWEGSLEWSVRALIDRIWFERRRARAQAG